MENDGLRKQERKSALALEYVTPLAIEDGPRIYNRKPIEGLKKDLERAIKDEIKHPEYPVDMIDKLWDDYHEARASPNKVLEFKDGETREGKVCLKAEDYSSIIEENAQLRSEMMDMRRKLDERDTMIWELRSKLDNERKSSKWAQSERANKLT
jgi:RNAse (barnase) inhibitor barstar